MVYRFSHHFIKEINYDSMVYTMLSYKKNPKSYFFCIISTILATFSRLMTAYCPLEGKNVFFNSLIVLIGKN